MKYAAIATIHSPIDIFEVMMEEKQRAFAFVKSLKDQIFHDKDDEIDVDVFLPLSHNGVI